MRSYVYHLRALRRGGKVFAGRDVRRGLPRVVLLGDDTQRCLDQLADAVRRGGLARICRRGLARARQDLLKDRCGGNVRHDQRDQILVPVRGRVLLQQLGRDDRPLQRIAEEHLRSVRKT